MSLLENKKNSRIKQLNQISEYSENKNNKLNSKNNITKDSLQKENKNEEEEDEEEEEDDNISEGEYNEGNEEDEEEEIDEENLSLLSLYKYKLNYDDNIKLYPRPDTNSFIYKNLNSENKYISNQMNIEVIPSSRAYFTNIEESNSYIKLIRPSQYIIPNNISKFNNTLNLFGLNIEPFALDEKQNSLEFIQKINIEYDNKICTKILKCGKCNAFYHKLNFNLLLISDSNFYQNYKYYCFVCKNYEKFFSIESSLDENQQEQNIDMNKIFFVPKKLGYKPSIEYIIENNNDNNINIKNMIQIIIIDLSKKEFVKFIYELLTEKLSETNEKELNINSNSIKYVLIAYYFNKIYFIYLNKINNSICISIMSDLKHPFCPIEPHKLLCSKNNFIELLANFYNSFFSNITKFDNDKTSFNYTNLNNGIIKSIFSLIKANEINKDINKYYYHLIFFSLSNHNINIDLFKENKINNIFLSFFLITPKKNINIPFIDNMNIHNIKLYYFPIEYENVDDINQKYKEINIIIDKLLNIQNYIFDITINLCYDKNIFKNDNNDDIINIEFIPNKISLNKIYILPQIGNLNILSSIYIQFHIEYNTLFDKYKYIRILTLINKISNDPIEVFKSYDEEVLFRINLAYHIKELNLSKNNYNSINKLYMNIINKIDKSFSKIIYNIINKIKKTYGKFHKEGFEKKGIFIQKSAKFFPLFFFSFIKQISIGQNLNILNLLYECKLNSFIKSIYPNLISLKYKSKSNEEKFYLRPLSISFMDRNQLLLYDDGLFITLLINNEIKDRVKEHYLKNYEDNEKMCFKVDSDVINNIIKNKYIKIIFLNDDMILKKNILNIFLEDKIIENINNDIDDEEKFELVNEYIQNDISYSDFYRIITQNIYEYFE